MIFRRDYVTFIFSISIVKYIHSEELVLCSTTSSCVAGLLNDVDNICLVGLLNSSFHVARFQLQRKTDPNIYDSICPLYMTTLSCGESKNLTCYCNNNSSAGLQVILNTTVNSDFSESLIRLTAAPPGGLERPILISRKLPTVYNISFENLTVNGKAFDENHCQVTETPVNVMYCYEDMDVCHWPISSRHEFISYDKQCVFYKIAVTQTQVDLKLEIPTCYGCQRRKYYTCKVKDFKTSIKAQVPCVGKCLAIEIVYYLFYVIHLITVVTVLSTCFKDLVIQPRILSTLVLLSCCSEMGQSLLIVIEILFFQDSYMDTSVPMWIICLIFKIISLTLLVFLEVCLLYRIKKVSPKNHLTNKRTLKIFICIHSVIGMFFIVHFLPRSLTSTISGTEYKLTDDKSNRQQNMDQENARGNYTTETKFCSKYESLHYSKEDMEMKNTCPGIPEDDTKLTSISLVTDTFEKRQNPHETATEV